MHGIELREKEGGVFQRCNHAPIILASVNPPIMAFIASKNTGESVTRQEHAFQNLLLDGVHMCVKPRPKTYSSPAPPTLKGFVRTELSVDVSVCRPSSGRT